MEIFLRHMEISYILFTFSDKHVILAAEEKSVKKINPNVNRKNYSFYHLKKNNLLDVIPFECGHEVCAKDKPVLNLTYNYFSLHCVVRGTGYYRIANVLHKVTKNQIFAFFPGERIEYYADQEDPWEYYWVNFVGVKAQDFMNLCQFTKNAPCYAFQNTKIIRFFRSLIHHEEMMTRDILTISRLYEIFAWIIEERKSDFLNSTIYRNVIEEAIAYVTDHYEQPDLTEKTVATQIGYSSKYLSQLFKKKVGISFPQYLTRLRVMKACEYIEKSNLSIKQIAHMVGFTDSLYFSKCFSAVLRTPPSRYRDTCDAKSAPLPVESRFTT